MVNTYYTVWLSQPPNMHPCGTDNLKNCPSSRQQASLARQMLWPSTTHITLSGWQQHLCAPHRFGLRDCRGKLCHQACVPPMPPIMHSTNHATYHACHQSCMPPMPSLIRATNHACHQSCVPPIMPPIMHSANHATNHACHQCHHACHQSCWQRWYVAQPCVY